MHYIVFDLEWNQSPKGKEDSVPGMPFEIIEIGAVKLNEHLEKEGEYCELVCPQEYMTIHFQIRKMLSYTMKDLKKGRLFQDVCKDFLAWCGDDAVFCTWGPGDLTELERNMNHFGVANHFPKPLLFLDLQKIYSMEYQDGKVRSSLQHVVEELKIPETKGDYHRAISDARYTAAVAQKLDFEQYGKYKSVDLYRIPDSVEDEFHLNFGTYEKYVSHGVEDHEQCAQDKKLRIVKCYVCQKKAKARTPWFSDNQGRYFGVFECTEHGLIKGRYRVKQDSETGLYYGIRILKQTDREGADAVVERKRRVEEKAARRLEARRQEALERKQMANAAMKDAFDKGLVEDVQPKKKKSGKKKKPATKQAASQMPATSQVGANSATRQI